MLPTIYQNILMHHYASHPLKPLFSLLPPPPSQLVSGEGGLNSLLVTTDGNHFGEAFLTSKSLLAPQGEE
jgi:hypothetical protein